MGRYVLLHVSGKSSQGENFDESSFVMQLLLKELQGAPKSILCHICLGNE